MSKTRCPFRFGSKEKACPAIEEQKTTLQFEASPERSRWVEACWWIVEQFSKVSWLSLWGAWRTYFDRDINSTLRKICRNRERLSVWPTPLGTQFVTRDPKVARVILSYYRNDEESIFYSKSNEEFLIDGMAQDLFPEEMAGITDRERELINVMVFSAEAAYVPGLRSCIMGMLGQKSVQDYREQLEQIAHGILDQMSPQELSSVDPTLLAFEYAVTAVSQILTSYRASREEYQAIARAMRTIGQRTADRIIQKPSADSVMEAYPSALQTMRSVVDKSSQPGADGSYSPVVTGLHAYGMSPFGIRLYLFFFYLAAIETTAATMKALMLELSRPSHHHDQEEIRKEAEPSLIKKCVVEALRLNSPVFVIGRTLRKDQLLTERNADGQIVWSRLLRRGVHLVMWIGGMGRDPEVYSDPDRFHPRRFSSIPTQLPWMPFAAGPHSCPGQWLARAEIEAFVKIILSRFQMENLSGDVPIVYRGTFTQHADPDGLVRMRFMSLQERSEGDLQSAVTPSDMVAAMQSPCLATSRDSLLSDPD